VKVFFDTSVLVAALVRDHQRHERAFDQLRRSRGREPRPVVSSHTLAELYSVLTTLPVSPAITPAMALRLIDESVEAHAEIVPVSTAIYREAIRHLAQQGLSGGVIYDAIACRAAIRAGAEVILTFNTRDFIRIRPPGGPRIEEP
jgi:predicted nucleic acid-binding protein